MPPIVREVVVAAATVKVDDVHWISEVHISTHKMMGSIGITGTSEIATSDTPGAAYNVDEYNEQGVPSKRQCIHQSDSYNVFGVVNRGSARGISVKRERVCEPDSESTSEPELQMIALRPRPLLPTMSKQCRTCRCLFLSGNWRYISSYTFYSTSEYSSKTTTFKEDVNVLIVSTSDHSTLQADLTGPPVGYVHLGTCDQTYQRCAARFWYEEHIKNNPRNARPKYHRCCMGMRVVLRTYKKQIEKDKVRQLTIMNLAVEFNNASTTKDNMWKAYEECNDIPQEKRDLIDTLKKESDKEYEMHNALFRKATKVEQQINNKVVWMHVKK
nr:hypothetical protein [Tanacetum cinerariifolium]